MLSAIHGYAGKVHGSLARAGKVRGQTPKVQKQDKKKQPKGRAMKRIKYNRRFVNVGELIKRYFLAVKAPTAAAEGSGVLASLVSVPHLSCCLHVVTWTDRRGVLYTPTARLNTPLVRSDGCCVSAQWLASARRRDPTPSKHAPTETGVPRGTSIPVFVDAASGWPA